MADSLDKFKSEFAGRVFDKTGGILGKRNGADWPQATQTDKGFLPVGSISPLVGGGDQNADASKLSEFGIKDWRGVLLNTHPDSDDYGLGVKDFTTLEKMKLSSTFPASVDDQLLGLDSSYTFADDGFSPYSNRDMYKIFNDTSTDYFKHGIYIDRENLGTEDGNFVSTPEENNDPVIFGFDIIIDVVTSPLLNGSIIEFIEKFGGGGDNNLANIQEVLTKVDVYKDFKKQIVKIFKTNQKIKGDTDYTGMLSDIGKSNINQSANGDKEDTSFYGKAAYMSYYLKKIDGLKALSENNDSTTFKYLTDYRKDTIKLSFTEDVSLTLGTLASLYKLLYWSKPNGKSLIPENLLRFNCDIVVSELRNYSRVKASGGQVDIIKDNLSRYVYSLSECQFFFNERPHGDSIDNTNSSVYNDYQISFDYKFSTTRFERWNPNLESYFSYNDGGSWKEGGNGGFEKVSPGGFGSVINGVGNDGGFLIKKYVTNNSEVVVSPAVSEDVSRMDKIKIAGKQAAKNAAKVIGDRAKYAASQAIQTQMNKATALVNQSLNKALNAIAGTEGIKPPTNVYSDNTTQTSRFFYDVRGNLADFAGNAITGLI